MYGADYAGPIALAIRQAYLFWSRYRASMLALSIRQPFAELILRRINTVVYRTRATRIVEERFHIYASKSPAKNI